MSLTALPKLCYELNNSGADAAGFGPTMTGASYVAGLLSQAMDATGSPNTVLTAPGFDFSATSSLGAWFFLSTDFLSVDDDSMQLTVGSTALSKGVTVQVISPTAGTMSAVVYGVTKTFASPAAGWHYISASLGGGNAELFLDGVSLGAPETATVSADTDNVTVSGGYSTGIKIDQFSIFDITCSASDWLYVVNGGSGIAYASMSAGGGAGARFAGSLFLLGVG